MGRQLLYRFHAAGGGKLQAGAIFGMEHSDCAYKRIYRITAEALGPAIEAMQILKPGAYAMLLRQTYELEASPKTVVFKLPDF